MSLWGLMLVGLTFTTEIFLASFSRACSCLSSSLANMAAKTKTNKDRREYVIGILASMMTDKKCLFPLTAHFKDGVH